MKDKKPKKNFVVPLIISIFMVTSFLIYSFAVNYLSKERVYEDIKSRITEDVLSSNVMIIKEKDSLGTNSEVKGYGVGFSGVIFQKEEGEYLVLTTCHALDLERNGEFVVLSYNEKTINDYMSAGGKYMGVAEYYSQFPRAKVRYYNEEYDLAVLSFKSDLKLGTLNIAEGEVSNGERVVAISNAFEEERNLTTYGKIKGRGKVKFKDEKDKMKYSLAKHSAYINVGSSGSVLLNENLEIVGINIGGAKDVFGNFRHGLAITSEDIHKFLEEYRK